MQYRLGTPYNDYLFSRIKTTPSDPAVVPGSSGFFATPRPGLDPRIIDPSTGKISAPIREGVLQLLYDFWRAKYHEPEYWSTVWIAGSALSHQYDEAGADLDVLIGVNYERFLEKNPDYEGFTETQLDQRFNHEFDLELEPSTAAWQGFETTFYVNPGGDDITKIHPYAAFNLTKDDWTVEPVELPADWNPRDYFPAEWWQVIDADIDRAKQVVSLYHSQADEVRRLPDGSPMQFSKLAQARQTLQRAASMFDEVHSGRQEAFRGNGMGYFDYNNLRFQAHQQAGTVKALHDLKVLNRDSREAAQNALYGEKLAGANDSLTAASLVTAAGNPGWYRRRLGI